MEFTFILLFAVILLAVWFAWRYYTLRREMDLFAKLVRRQKFDTHIKDLENLSSAVTSLVLTFDLRLSTLNSERDRLATVLDQLTDGVLIADAQGIIQFANPVAGKLFQSSNPVQRSLTEVIRHHQLVEAWRRCRQTGALQSESVEVPTRHQFLQLPPRQALVVSGPVGMRDRYTITERLDHRGRAEVFRGVAESMQGFKTSVAIKRILPSLTKNQKFVSMFLDEARLSLFLQHANIVQVFDISRTPDNAYFLVMEYVDGCNLKALIERQKQKGKRIEIAHSIYLMIECCKALQYAHGLEYPETNEPLGIVHRDISPPNILLSKNGEVG